MRGGVKKRPHPSGGVRIFSGITQWQSLKAKIKVKQLQHFSCRRNQELKIFIIDHEKNLNNKCVLKMAGRLALKFSELVVSTSVSVKSEKS